MAKKNKYFLVKESSAPIQYPGWIGDIIVVRNGYGVSFFDHRIRCAANIFFEYPLDEIKIFFSKRGLKLVEITEDQYTACQVAKRLR